MENNRWKSWMKARKKAAAGDPARMFEAACGTRRWRRGKIDRRLVGPPATD
jgi:hypothetical protein